MKTLACTVLVVAQIFSTGAFAQNSASSQKEIKALLQQQVDGTSKEQMQQALKELNVSLQGLQNDLSSAKKTNDGRLSVKVRNYMLGTLGASVAILFLDLGIQQVAQMTGQSTSYTLFGSETVFALNLAAMEISVLVSVGAALGTTVAEGVVLLTPSQANQINSQIIRIQTKIQTIQARLNQ